MSQEDAQAIEAARKFFAGPCDYVLSAMKVEQLPDMDLPEVAFIGRSNVGKSSLINALTGRNALARVSQTPGRTRQLNFFNLADTVHLVDMPGYGYAKAPKDEVKEWNYLIKDYLRGRVTLRRVFLLVDARHGMKETDTAFLKLLGESAVSTQIILTKADAVKPAELDKMIKETEGKLKKSPAALPSVLAVSSEKTTGIPELRAHIHALTAF